MCCIQSLSLIQVVLVPDFVVATRGLAWHGTNSFFYRTAYEGLLLVLGAKAVVELGLLVVAVGGGLLGSVKGRVVGGGGAE